MQDKAYGAGGDFNLHTFKGAGGDYIKDMELVSKAGRSQHLQG